LTLTQVWVDGFIASAKPFFELMGKNVTLVGENGDGQTAKVANQIIVALTIEAVGEALLFASKELIRQKSGRHSHGRICVVSDS
jgi:2-hydroxy-3-oxopropionate reductase